MPLQVAETAPLGQPPLSRPIDQNAVNLTPLLRAQATVSCASCKVKVSGRVSFAPIIGVMPSWVLFKPMPFNWPRVA